MSMHPKGKLVHASVVCFSFATGCQARMPLLYGRMQIPPSIPARMVHKIWPSLASQVEVIHAQCWAPLAATQNNSSRTQPINNSLHPGPTHLQTNQMHMYHVCLCTSHDGPEFHHHPGCLIDSQPTMPKGDDHMGQAKNTSTF